MVCGKEDLLSPKLRTFDVMPGKDFKVKTRIFLYYCVLKTGRSIGID